MSTPYSDEVKHHPNCDCPICEHERDFELYGPSTPDTERAVGIKEALDSHLPAGYAIGDEATASLAVQLAERDKDLAANERDWNVIAQELGCENIREEMVKQIRILRGKL